MLFRHALHATLILGIVACGGSKEGGEGALELFRDVCPVPGWASPWESPLSGRWTPVPSTDTPAYASFLEMTDGTARSMVGAAWKDVLTGEESSVDIAVEMTAANPPESVIWSFDESGLGESDVLGWETTGLHEISDIPGDWPACDKAVVTGPVTGVYRHGSEVWAYEGQMTNADGVFVLSFDSGPDHGDVAVRMEFDNDGDLIAVSWMDDAGETVAAGWVDDEAVAD